MAEEKLIVDFWDVGQGDCSVIRLPDSSLVIIDVGPRTRPLIDWLQEKPRRIHSIVITHNDADHAGGLPGLVSACQRTEDRAVPVGFGADASARMLV